MQHLASGCMQLPRAPANVSAGAKCGGLHLKLTDSFVLLTCRAEELAWQGEMLRAGGHALIRHGPHVHLERHHTLRAPNCTCRCFREAGEAEELQCQAHCQAQRCWQRSRHRHLLIQLAQRALGLALAIKLVSMEPNLGSQVPMVTACSPASPCSRPATQQTVQCCGNRGLAVRVTKSRGGALAVQFKMKRGQNGRHVMACQYRGAARAGGCTASAGQTWINRSGARLRPRCAQARRGRTSAALAHGSSWWGTTYTFPRSTSMSLGPTRCAPRLVHCTAGATEGPTCVSGH